MKRLIWVPALMLLRVGQAMALTVEAKAPCNIFSSGQPMVFAVGEAQGDVRYELTNYHGDRVDVGSTSDTSLTLQAKQPGWYELKCSDSVGSVSIPVGVIINRGDAPLPKEGRVSIDSCSVWYVPEPRRKDYQSTLRRAGISHVRERYSWLATQPTPGGEIAWQSWDEFYKGITSEGISVVSHWADYPDWAKGNPWPSDLRDAYRFAKETAIKFAGRVEAWEMLNEPDAGGVSEQYAPFVKATYLGMKDGDPKVKVLLGSMCQGITPFLNHIYGAGLGDYFDLFNWHLYADPRTYPSALNKHQEAMKRAGISPRPSWMTEAGIAIYGTEGEGHRLLNKDGQRRQCSFIPKSYAASLAAGNQRHYFFMVPDLLENGVQFGSMMPNVTPYPAFIAISASANMLGDSDYLGDYKPAGAGVTAKLFSTPRGNVLAVWSEGNVEFSIPTEKKNIMVADMFGAETAVDARDGKLTVKVGQEAVYLIDVGRSILAKCSRAPKLVREMPKNRPSHAVIRSYCELERSLSGDNYVLRKPQAFDYKVEVYNLDDTRTAEGTIRIVVPNGWEVDSPKRDVRIAPMGREDFVVKVNAREAKSALVMLSMTGAFNGKKCAPANSHFFQSVPPVRTKPLDWMDASKWDITNISSCGTLALSNPTPDMLHYDIKFGPGCDPWAYPVLRFGKPVDLSGYDGIAFDWDSPVNAPGTLVRLMMAEESGATYMISMTCVADQHRHVFLFRDMAQNAQKGLDPDGRLSLDKIHLVQFGANVTVPELSFKVGNFELVEFGLSKQQ